MTQRLPIPGADGGGWGDVLNGFLEVSHNSDGTLANNTVGANQIQSNAITNAELDSNTQSAIDKANSALQIGGDIGGTSAAPIVNTVNGGHIPVTAAHALAISGTPANGQVLVATGSNSVVWQTPATGSGVGYEEVANKGQVNGYAALDNSGIVELSDLPTIASSHGLLTATRESESALLASASVQSAPYDTQDPSSVGADGIGQFSAITISDQAGTLQIKSSPDGSTWTVEATISTGLIGSSQVARWDGIPSQRYVQAIETNGSTAQTRNSFCTVLTLLQMS